MGYRCQTCGAEGDDVELYAAESADEPDVVHCHVCGADRRVE